MKRWTELTAATALCASILVSVTGASAQEQPDAEGASDWSFSLGGFAVVAPEYEGSDDYTVSGFPNVEIEWRDRVFLKARDGLGVNILNDGMVRLSASVGYGFGRDEDDSDDLAGLGDVDGGALAIVNGSVSYDGFTLSTRVSYQFTGDDTGILADIGAGYMWRSADGWFVNGGLNTSLASGDYMDSYFSVTPSQSAASGLQVFDAEPGFKSVGVRLAPGYAIDENWSVIGTLSYDRLVGDAGDSPITRSEDQFAAGVGISWRY